MPKLNECKKNDNRIKIKATDVTGNSLKKKKSKEEAKMAEETAEQSRVEQRNKKKRKKKYKKSWEKKGRKQRSQRDREEKSFYGATQLYLQE